MTTTIFDDSRAAVESIFADAAGETVTYTRANVALVITAWRSPEPQSIGALDGQGMVVEFESWEWHLPLASLGAFGPPKSGDTILAADGRLYEVASLGGQRVYAGDALLRIHTKRVTPPPETT